MDTGSRDEQRMKWKIDSYLKVFIIIEKDLLKVQEGGIKEAGE